MYLAVALLLLLLSLIYHITDTIETNPLDGFGRGSGPRASIGMCPYVNASETNPSNGLGRGFGRGFGRGLGPRASMGICPYVNAST